MTSDGNVRHLSVRVPWHDSGWNGHFCRNPLSNQACLALHHIGEKRDDEQESRHAGTAITDVPEQEWPPCVAERGMFMAPFPVRLPREIPYRSPQHQHLKKTDLYLPPYSVPVVPFRWMLREMKEVPENEMGLELSYDDEPKEPDWLKDNAWWQGIENQKKILEAFGEPIVEEHSLVFFYAKQTQLTDDPRRVLCGVGRVKFKGEVFPYDYDGELPQGGLENMVWERAIQHSIRPQFEDGFILPYAELNARIDDDPTFDPSPYVAFAPDHVREQFSYAGEHVSHGGAIAALLNLRAAVERTHEIAEGPWDHCLDWIDTELNRLWTLRGPCPGLGSALTAFGIRRGTFMARAVADELDDETSDPWPLVDKILSGTAPAPPTVRQDITGKRKKKWGKTKTNDRKLLELISHFELGEDQATTIFSQSSDDVPDVDAILANPYLIYESSRWSADPVSLWVIDQGVHPQESSRQGRELPTTTSDLKEYDHGYRVRAFAVHCLDQGADNGDTVLPASELADRISSLPLEPRCKITADDLDLYASPDEFDGVIEQVPTTGSEVAYQLQEFTTYGTAIREFIESHLKRAGALRDVAGWRDRVDSALSSSAKADALEEIARSEKTRALEQLVSKGFAVLIGGAGTGKTTLVDVLCRAAREQGVSPLLLAPTGKARVRLEQLAGSGSRAYTLAQFLKMYDRYDPSTGHYRPTGGSRASGNRLVVVDEASMLTEPQLAALFDAVDPMAQVLLVGDPSQLPPIGPGRPFADIVSYLRPQEIDSHRFRVGAGYAELTVQRRQVLDDGGNYKLSGESRDIDDYLLAENFSGRPVSADAKGTLERLLQARESERVKFRKWDNVNDLRTNLKSILIDELEIDPEAPEVQFADTLGAVGDGNVRFFNIGSAANAEDWQILVPHRYKPGGTRDLNRQIHKDFKAGVVEWAENSSRSRKRSGATLITAPRGSEQIVYGDKVICTRNHTRTNVYPKEASPEPLKYVANGEIGIVVGELSKKGESRRPAYTNVAFSSQRGVSYGFNPRDFAEESSPLLELAYAVSVHKAQGSQFGLTVLVLPESSPLLSRELLYTALTRQRNRLLILHQGDLEQLRAFTNDFFSETARRKTNLFYSPNLQEVELPVGLQGLHVTREKRRFLEHHLIHASKKGEPLSSKSEVIIADCLADAESTYGISYEVEPIVRDRKGHVVCPDFRIVDQTGREWFWEHRGLLHQDQYSRNQEWKLDLYRSHGLVPWEEDPENGRLILTDDGPDKGISSKAIRELIDQLWGGVSRA